MENQVAAPGRVNLIGEHIDYHGFPVLPMALRRAVRVRYQARRDGIIRATSEGFGTREFLWTSDLQPVKRGDWENYLRAAARLVAPGAGVDAEITSDLPPAAGLSSSSALIVAFTLALLRANGQRLTFEELMRVLPEGEHFVGTRGGGMDHAASLASRAGCASLIAFQPLAITHIPIPDSWAFLVAHSRETAEKSGPAREEYNARRRAGVNQHTTSEAARVEAAVDALRRNEPRTFGKLLLESHASLRDYLKVSTAALDALVESAMESGALGARLTGAGFGGCAVVLCRRADVERVREGMAARFYEGDASHIFEAEAGAGALG